jgi:hypothetical protein
MPNRHNEYGETYEQLRARVNDQADRIASLLDIDPERVATVISADSSGVVLLPSVADLVIAKLAQAD